MLLTVPSINYENESAEEQIHNQQLQENRPQMRFQSFINHYGTVTPRTPTIKRIKNQLNKFYNTLSCTFIINILLDRITIIRCLKKYNLRKYLFADIIAGITVAIMHIPQGMAYGILTTLPPIYGLYVSFFPVLLYMIFGTCPHLSVGTFAILSLMTAEAINEIPLESFNGINNQSYDVTLNLSDAMIINEKVGIATTLAFLVGLMQLILSFLRLGFVTVYMTEPFISGFTTGAAIHVFSSQIPSIFGVQSPRNVPVIFKLPRFYVKLLSSIIKNINWISTAIGFTSIIILFIAKQLNDRYKSIMRIIIPSELILVIIGTLISHFTQLHNRHGVSVVGPIKRGLPSPSSPSFNHISYLIIHAATITMELLAYGISNMVSFFFQCYPNTGSLSRSAVQEGSGGKTLLVGGFSCLILGIVIIALTPLFQTLPMACLAAIIIVNLKGLLFQIKDFFFYYRISTMEYILWIVTFATTILFDVDIGLYVGLCTTFLINTIRTQKPRFSVLGQVGDTEIYKTIKVFPLAQQYTNIKILRFDESLYACNAPFFKRKFYELIDIQLRQEPLIGYKKHELNKNQDIKYKYVILDCSPLNFIDTVGVKLLIEIYNDLKKRGILLYLSECRSDVRRTLELMNFYEKTAPGTIYVTTHHAVTAMKAKLDNDLQILNTITQI
ncbi:unnamed protein product [Rotaria sordida]|uniref:STAS domain-containing protein n=1 Tax=Rotaria sordida TaxID=392033 RepID=A0A819I2Z0_9BILA|nr:unnamed protein product [Rotaria sordida]CAF3912208.1 unnamed protein product [Rotaria sordida]